MTNDEILQAAKEAGMTKVQGEAALFWYPEVERFANIIEKRTIERCAEIAKQNEPVAWCVGYDDPRMGRIHANPTMCKPEAEALVKSTTSELIVCSLYALPPTAEQIANETAEACAKVIDQEACGGSAFNSASEYMAKKIRNGAWKEFK